MCCLDEKTINEFGLDRLVKRGFIGTPAVLLALKMGTRCGGRVIKIRPCALEFFKYPMYEYSNISNWAEQRIRDFQSTT